MYTRRRQDLASLMLLASLMSGCTIEFTYSGVAEEPPAASAELSATSDTLPLGVPREEGHRAPTAIAAPLDGAPTEGALEHVDAADPDFATVPASLPHQ